MSIKYPPGFLDWVAQVYGDDERKGILRRGIDDKRVRDDLHAFEGGYASGFKSKWVMIEEGPPPNGTEVLVEDGSGDVWIVTPNTWGGVQSYSPKENGCGCCSSNIYEVKRWMPLPELPDQVSKEVK